MSPDPHIEPLRVVTVPVAIACGHPALQAKIRMRYGAFATDSPAQGALRYDIQSCDSGDDMPLISEIFTQGLPHGIARASRRGDPPAMFNERCLNDLDDLILADVARQLPSFWFGHAAVMVLGGRAVLLMGSSGAGKSTLAYALNRRGAVYFSDDVAPVHKDTLQVFPYRKAIKLRPPSLALFGLSGSSGSDGPASRDLLVPSPACAGDSSAPIAAVIFMRRAASSRSHLSLCKPAQAFALAARCTIGGTTLEEQLHGCISRIASTIPCHELLNGDLGESVDLIWALAESSQIG